MEVGKAQGVFGEYRSASSVLDNMGVPFSGESPKAIRWNFHSCYEISMSPSYLFPKNND